MVLARIASSASGFDPSVAGNPGKSHRAADPAMPGFDPGSGTPLSVVAPLQTVGQLRAVFSLALAAAVAAGRPSGVAFPAALRPEVVVLASSLGLPSSSFAGLAPFVGQRPVVVGAFVPWWVVVLRPVAFLLVALGFEALDFAGQGKFAGVMVVSFAGLGSLEGLEPFVGFACLVVASSWRCRLVLDKG